MLNRNIPAVFGWSLSLFWFIGYVLRDFKVKLLQDTILNMASINKTTNDDKK